MKIHSIYESGEAVADRFTVYYKGRGSITPAQGGGVWRRCVGMSGEPFHPQGICQHGYGVPGPHNGRKIAFCELPPDCQKVVRRDLEGGAE